MTPRSGAAAAAKVKRRAPRRSRRRGAAREIRFYPNDPDATVGLVSATPLPALEGEPRYVIEGPSYEPAAYEPGTLEFQYWQGETALRRTIRVWEDLFDRDFTRWQGGRPLRVRLRAGRDLNAFYDRASLQFFYDENVVTGRMVYAAESLDIVAHEAGHAILDVYQPSYWSTPDPETAAFHEAFADCSSLLVTLTDPAVRRGLQDETKDAVRASNLVSRLAEALGRAVHDKYGPSAVSDPTRLRDANNAFRYGDPDDLPADGPDGEVTAEPHNFSRVFTGAFYDLLVWLIARELRDKEDDPDGAVDRARRLGGRLLARAIETLPPGTGRFLEIAVRMREIDQTEEGGVASIGIEAAFEGHGMPLPALEAPVAEGAEGRPAARSLYRARRALDPDRPGGVAAIRAALGLPAGAKLTRAAWTPKIGGAVREQLVHRDVVRVRHRSLGPFSGVAVPVVCGCTLTRDPSGAVEGATLLPHPHPSPAALARWLRPWIRRGEVAPRRGRAARSTSADHFRARHPFRVTPSGIVERVYFD